MAFHFPDRFDTVTVDACRNSVASKEVQPGIIPVDFILYNLIPSIVIELHVLVLHLYYKSGGQSFIVWPLHPDPNKSHQFPRVLIW